MAHDDEELTNPGRGLLSSDFADLGDEEEENEGTEEVTQVDTLDDRLISDNQNPVDINPFAGLDDDTIIPD